MAAWLWRGGAKTLSTCILSLIGLSVFLYTPAQGADWARCSEALEQTFAEQWGLPLSEEKPDAVDLIDRCAHGETLAAGLGDPGRVLTVGGLLEYYEGRNEEAARYWERGAASGDLLSMVALGDVHGFVFVKEGDPDIRLETAYGWYRKAAEAGSALGMSKLAFYYDQGYHVEEDPVEALRWYMTAAEAGDVTAMHNVAYFFEEGRGVSPDIDLAIRWYKWAGEAGSNASYYNLGVLYDEGIAVPKDDAKAVYYYRLAAYGGYPEAMHNLAWMYKHGAGIERDYAEALYWYEKAFNSGLEATGGNLGAMYYEGLGVEQDRDMALAYFVIAAEAGRAEAMANASQVFMENGAYREAYFWTVLAVVHGLTDVSFRLVELRRLLPEATLAAIESHSEAWTPGMPMPDFAGLSR